jgi:hypothetical protein
LKNHVAIHEREAGKGEEGKNFGDPSQRSSVKRKRSERKKKRERKDQGQPDSVKVEGEFGELAGKQDSMGQFLAGEEEDSDWEERQEDERDERMREDFRIGGKKKRRVYEDSVSSFDRFRDSRSPR